MTMRRRIGDGLRRAATDAAAAFCVALVGAGTLAAFAESSSAAAEPQRLTRDGRFKQDLAFVDRTGAELAYTVQETPTLLRLMRLRLADGESSPWTVDAQKNEVEATFSPDGAWMAFLQSRGNLSMALVIRPLPQGGDAEVKPSGGFCAFRSPAFSPDARRVFYSFADDDRQTILSVDRQGRDERKVIDGPGHANWPSVSPDGKRLAFGSTRDGNYEIYVADLSSDLASGAVRRLTDHPRQDIRPRFSPDGRRIAFTSGRDGNYEIYVMNADGGGLRRLTDHPERDDYAAWHPNSRQLAIVAERDGRHDVVLLDAP